MKGNIAMAFVQLNAYLCNARKHWRSLVIGIQIWDLMCQNHVGIVGTIQGNVRTAYLKAANSVLGRTKIRKSQSDEVKATPHKDEAVENYSK